MTIRFALALCLMLAPLAAAEPVGASLDGDAEGDYLAFSGTGDASSRFVAASGTGHASSSCREFGTIPCLTASGLGTTSGSPNTLEAWNERVCHNNGLGGQNCVMDGEGNSTGVIALSIRGNARGSLLAASVFGDSRGGYLSVGGRDSFSYGLTIAGSGHAANGWVSLSLLGNATGIVGVSPFGHASGILAVAPTGDANGTVLPVTLLGDATGFIAVSPTGDARSTCFQYWIAPCLEGAAIAPQGRAEGGVVSVGDQRALLP